MYFGVDKAEEPHLVGTVRLAVNAPLPSDWQELEDGDEPGFLHRSGVRSSARPENPHALPTPPTICVPPQRQQERLFAIPVVGSALGTGSSSPECCRCRTLMDLRVFVGIKKIPGSLRAWTQRSLSSGPGNIQQMCLKDLHVPRHVSASQRRGTVAVPRFLHMVHGVMLRRLLNPR